MNSKTLSEAISKKCSLTRQKYLQVSPNAPLMRLLMHPDTFRGLKSETEFLRENGMRSWQDEPTFHGILIIENEFIETWELVVVEP